MAEYAAGGGKIDQEGFLKHILHLFRTGYANGWAISQRGAGANMSVDVSVGGGLIATSANVPYYGWSDAIKNVTVATSDPSNPRIDTLVAYIDLSAITSATTNNLGALKFKAVTGTAAASPSAPNSTAIQSSVGAGNPYDILADIAVGTSASSIVNANITDRRLPMAFQVPYLWGGSNNTKGHLLPNVADDTVALIAAAQTLTNKTINANQLVDASMLSQKFAPTTKRATAVNTGNTGTAWVDAASVSFSTSEIPVNGKVWLFASAASAYMAGTGNTFMRVMNSGATVQYGDTVQTSANASPVGVLTVMDEVAVTAATAYTFKIQGSGSNSNAWQLGNTRLLAIYFAS